MSRLILECVHKSRQFLYVRQTINQIEGEQKDKLKRCKLLGRNVIMTFAYIKHFEIGEGKKTGNRNKLEIYFFIMKKNVYGKYKEVADYL